MSTIVTNLLQVSSRGDLQRAETEQSIPDRMHYYRIQILRSRRHSDTTDRLLTSSCSSSSSRKKTDELAMKISIITSNNHQTYCKWGHFHTQHGAHWVLMMFDMVCTVVDNDNFIKQHYKQKLGLLLVLLPMLQSAVPTSYYYY